MEEKVYTLLDMSDYTYSGEGANGASYDCISDPGIMVKLYNESYDLNAIEVEQDLAKKVFSIGVPSPEPGELVTDGKRKGIRFRRIVGKRSFSRIFADEPERYDEYAREYARYVKKLHSVKCPAGMFPSAKEQALEWLKVCPDISDNARRNLAKFIAEVPDADTALQGDMHMGNILSNLPKGAPLSDPHNIYFIDLGSFAYGYPLFDFGMLLMICIISNDEFRQHDFHIGAAITRKVWDSFVDEYFFGPEKLGEKYFGKDVKAEDIENLLKPYAAVKALLVSFNIGFTPPEYLENIEECFG